MKTIAIILVTASMCFAVENSLKPAGKPVSLTITPGFTIQLPPQPTGPEKKAAADLRQWLREIGDVELPIGSSDKVIKIFTNPQFADEQFQIEVTGDTLQLSGGPNRGVVNAVYALLEEDLGCRWYTASDTKLPKLSPLKIDIVPRIYKPQLRVRDAMYGVANNAEWSLRNRAQCQGAKVPEEFGGVVDYGNMMAHTAARLLPPDKYFKDHPEYFFLDKTGKRNQAQWCPTHADVAKIVSENALQYLRENPHVEIVSVSKNDSGGDQICQCDTCKKLRDAEGSEMACQLVLVNHVAEAIEKEFPNAAIDTLAYLDTIPVPKTMRPRKNVVIHLCNDTVGAWNQPFTTADKCPVAKIAQAWAKVCDRIYIWDYTVNFSHYLAPMPNMDVVADDIRFWIANHAEGVMLEGAYSDVGERDEMRIWCAAKVMWDPTLDEKALENDFLEGHYAQAAPMLKEYEDLLASSRKQYAAEFEHPPGGIRYPMTMKFLSKDFLDRADDIFARAKQVAANDKDLLVAVERAELPILYVHATRGEKVDEFERIAHRENIHNLEEAGPSFDDKLAAYRKKAATATRPAAKAISHGPAAGTYQAFPDICRLKNGDLFCVFYAGYGHVTLPSEDFPKGGRICYVKSSDEGATWTEPKILFDDDDDNRDSHVAQLDNGDIICTFFGWRLSGEKLKSSKDFSWNIFHERAKLLGASMVRSHDNGATWDSVAQSIDRNWVCSAPVRQLPDGTCILGLYRQLNDKEKIWFGGVTRSHDRGQTWEPPVSIGEEARLPLDAETDIIQLKEGSLLAALRSSKINLHFATSTDLGKTWSAPRDSGFHGESPHLNRLSTGEILLSVRRRPDTALHISRDDGKTWTGPFSIDNVIGAYPSTVELKDKSVLIVYYTEGPGSEIRALRFRLTPDGIEKLPSL